MKKLLTVLSMMLASNFLSAPQADARPARMHFGHCHHHRHHRHHHHRHHRKVIK